MLLWGWETKHVPEKQSLFLTRSDGRRTSYFHSILGGFETLDVIKKKMRFKMVQVDRRETKVSVVSLPLFGVFFIERHVLDSFYESGNQHPLN